MAILKSKGHPWTTNSGSTGYWYAKVDYSETSATMYITFPSSGWTMYGNLTAHVNGEKVGSKSYGLIQGETKIGTGTIDPYSTNTVSVTVGGPTSGGQNGTETITIPQQKSRYTVSYDANGGGTAPSSQTVNAGSSVTLASMNNRVSYPTGTLYLYYNANGGSGAPGTQSDTYTNKDTIAFNGWKVNNTGTLYAGGSSYTPTSNVTMYAQWGGATSIRYSNPTITISNTRPTRTYYTFKGWSTNQYATSASYSPGSNITISSNTTLYAVWQPNPPINLVISRTGSNTTSISVSVSATGLTMTNYTLYYRVKNSGNYASKSLGTSTTGTITGLAIDTDYQIYFTATNAGGTSTSGVVIYSTTLNNPSLTNPVKSNTFPFMTTITAIGSVTPNRTLTYAFSKDGGSTWTGYQSSNSYHWTGLNEETTYSMGVRVKATHVGVNASDTTATKYISVTTPTNQARMRIKKDGQWKKGRTFIKKDGVWKKADKIYIKVNGVWVEDKNFYDGEPSLWD